jgi:hypothetical protein
MTQGEAYSFSTPNFLVSLSGLSRDLHTNRWSVTSKCCNENFTPKTTMMRYQTVQCPKCKKEECLDYNEGKSYVAVTTQMRGTNLTISF